MTEVGQNGFIHFVIRLEEPLAPLNVFVLNLCTFVNLRDQILRGLFIII